MKTSIEISDPILAQIREIAARDRRSLRELVEAGLRMVIQEDQAARSFRLRDASVGGRGLRQGLSYDDWGKILELGYDRRS